MSLRLDRMLAPICVAPAILGQCTRGAADLLGDKGNHRCWQRLISKDRPTEMAQKTELNGQTKAVVQGRLAWIRSSSARPSVQYRIRLSSSVGMSTRADHWSALSRGRRDTLNLPSPG